MSQARAHLRATYHHGGQNSFQGTQVLGNAVVRSVRLWKQNTLQTQAHSKKLEALKGPASTPSESRPQLAWGAVTEAMQHIPEAIPTPNI